MAGKQKNIAAALKLSPATVSRSLKNDPMISAETRAKVAQMALQLGYRMQQAEETLGSSQPTAEAAPPYLCVLCRGELSPQSVFNIVQLRILQGMSAGARSAGARLDVEYLPSEEFDRLSDPQVWPPLVRRKAVAGLVLHHTRVSQEALRALSAHLPCLTFITPPPEVAVDSVTEDNTRSIAQLVAHLRALGHRKIGLGDFGWEHISDQERLAGYVQAMVANRLEWDMSLANYLPADIAEAQRSDAIAEHVIRQRSQGVTAWICPDDTKGYALVAALQRRGVRVPQDVSVCGFDNFDPPAGLPKLTTINAPFELMGQVAVWRLLRRADGHEGPPVHIRYGCALIEGQSTGPAPRGV